MEDARECGTVWIIVQRAGIGYVGEFSGYPVSVEQATRVGPSTQMVVFGIEDR